LPDDRSIEGCYDGWPLDDPAVPPERWVLFHPQQYAEPGFPFEPFGRTTVCRWACCRRALTAEPCWGPEEVVYLFARAGTRHRLCPSVSTGLSCGRAGDPVLLRGLQEVIERDALMGAWWGRYALEERDAAQVFAYLNPDLPDRLHRPNLRYRFYLIASP